MATTHCRSACRWQMGKQNGVLCMCVTHLWQPLHFLIKGSRKSHQGKLVDLGCGRQGSQALLDLPQLLFELVKSDFRG